MSKKISINELPLDHPKWQSLLVKVPEETIGRLVYLNVPALDVIFDQLWSLVDNHGEKVKFADTDWPLRIARILYEATMDESVKVNFEKLIRIRNVCPDGETNTWFMAAALRESILLDPQIEQVKPMKSIRLMNYYYTSHVTNALRHFDPVKMMGDSRPLWEIALTDLGVDDEVIDSLRIAIMAFSVDFTKKENFLSALMILGSGKRYISERTELDLMGMEFIQDASNA